MKKTVLAMAVAAALLGAGGASAEDQPRGYVLNRKPTLMTQEQLDQAAQYKTETVTTTTTETVTDTGDAIADNVIVSDTVTPESDGATMVQNVYNTENVYTTDDSYSDNGGWGNGFGWGLGLGLLTWAIFDNDYNDGYYWAPPAPPGPPAPAVYQPGPRREVPWR